MVISSPAATAVSADGSVSMTWSGGTVELGLLTEVRVLKPRFCRRGDGVRGHLAVHVGNLHIARADCRTALIAMVTTTVSTASTATATSHAPDRCRCPTTAESIRRAGMCSVGAARGRADRCWSAMLVRSASVKTFGASGCFAAVHTDQVGAHLRSGLMTGFSGILASALSTTASSSGEMSLWRRDGGAGSSRTC